MPIIAAASKRAGREAGFTLIELIVVLAVISLLAAVATSAMRGRSPSYGRDRLRVQLRALIASAEASARTTGRPAVVDLNALEGGNATVAPAIGKAADRILVHADGSTTGGTIKLAGRPLAQLDWLTGRITDAR